MDWERLASFMKISWKMPENFPVAALAASRAFYWLVDDDPILAKRLALATYDNYFGHGRDITNTQTMADIVEPLGVNRDELLIALEEPINKQRLKDETSKAIDAGVFGSPFFIIDGELFWGSDRLWMIKRWLKSGGW
jgi:2-hydroxychromene-2-carboxylate isomerase